MRNHNGLWLEILSRWVVPLKVIYIRFALILQIYRRGISGGWAIAHLVLASNQYESPNYIIFVMIIDCFNNTPN